jgi:ribonuclease J
MIHPRLFVPVHGDYRLLHHNAELAMSCGIPRERIRVLEDGRVVELTPDSITVTEQNVSGLVFVDGLGIGDVEQVVLRDRRQMSQDGMLVAALGIDRDTGKLRTGPDLISRGVIGPELSADLEQAAGAAVVNALRQVGTRPNVVVVQDLVHDTLSRLVWKRTGRRPMIVPVVTEL